MNKKKTNIKAPSVGVERKKINAEVKRILNDPTERNKYIIKLNMFLTEYFAAKKDNSKIAQLRNKLNKNN